MTRRCEKGIVYIALYVDDCYCVGHEEAIQDTITKIIANGFDVKVEDDLTDYLSCNILFNKNKTKAWLGQPHLIKNLEKKYGEAVKSLQAYKTPGTPGQGIVRPDKGETSVLASPEDQTLYRSGVGMLLYLVKHSRPDIANVVRELSKVMDGATPAAIKEMKRVIKFVLDTRHYVLKIEPVVNGIDDDWVITVYTNSDYAGDKNNHHFPTWSCDYVAFKGTKISHFVLSRSGILQSIRCGKRNQVRLSDPIEHGNKSEASNHRASG